MVNFGSMGRNDSESPKKENRAARDHPLKQMCDWICNEAFFPKPWIDCDRESHSGRDIWNVTLTCGPFNLQITYPEEVHNLRARILTYDLMLAHIYPGEHQVMPQSQPFTSANVERSNFNDWVNKLQKYRLDEQARTQRRLGGVAEHQTRIRGIIQSENQARLAQMSNTRNFPPYSLVPKTATTQEISDGLEEITREFRANYTPRRDGGMMQADARREVPFPPMNLLQRVCRDAFFPKPVADSVEQDGCVHVEMECAMNKLSITFPSTIQNKDARTISHDLMLNFIYPNLHRPRDNARPFMAAQVDTIPQNVWMTKLNDFRLKAQQELQTSLEELQSSTETKDKKRIKELEKIRDERNSQMGNFFNFPDFSSLPTTCLTSDRGGRGEGGRGSRGGRNRESYDMGRLNTGRQLHAGDYLGHVSRQFNLDLEWDIYDEGESDGLRKCTVTINRDGQFYTKVDNTGPAVVIEDGDNGTIKKRKAGALKKSTCSVIMDKLVECGLIDTAQYGHDNIIKFQKEKEEKAAQRRNPDLGKPTQPSWVNNSSGSGALSFGAPPMGGAPSSWNQPPMMGGYAPPQPAGNAYYGGAAGGYGGYGAPQQQQQQGYGNYGGGAPAGYGYSASAAAPPKTDPWAEERPAAKKPREALLSEAPMAAVSAPSNVEDLFAKQQADLQKMQEQQMEQMRKLHEQQMEMMKSKAGGQAAQPQQPNSWNAGAKRSAW